MVKYTHRSGGGGAPIQTTSCIYDYSTGNGGEAPEYFKGEYPADKVTRKLPVSKGESPKRVDDRVPPKNSESGAHFMGKSGPTAVPQIERGPRGKTAPLDRGIPRGIPDRDRFNSGMGFGAGNTGSARNDRGVAYKDGEGRTKYRGRSG